MTIDFTCQKCDSSFELDAQDLIDGTEKLVCPNCGAKGAPSQVDDFTSALSDLRTAIGTLSKKFSVALALESEDLADLEEEEEDEEEDADDDEDESEDDELDFDSDEEDEDVEDEAEEA
jgi:hypothetical protein